jgi:hypothetical protein
MNKLEKEMKSKIEGTHFLLSIKMDILVYKEKAREQQALTGY